MRYYRKEPKGLDKEISKPSSSMIKKPAEKERDISRRFRKQPLEKSNQKKTGRDVCNN